MHVTCGCDALSLPASSLPASSPGSTPLPSPVSCARRLALAVVFPMELAFNSSDEMATLADYPNFRFFMTALDCRIRSLDMSLTCR